MTDTDADDTDPELCIKCGQEVDGDWDDSHPEPLCFGCSHMQNGIDDQP